MNFHKRLTTPGICFPVYRHYLFFVVSSSLDLLFSTVPSDPGASAEQGLHQRLYFFAGYYVQMYWGSKILKGLLCLYEGHG